MKRVVGFLLMIVMSLSVIAFGGCGDMTVTIDPDKTQLYVGVTETGYGRDWFDIIKENFEKNHPDVQIIDDFDPAKYKSSARLEAEIPSDKIDVYIAGGVEIARFVARTNKTSNYFADITDVITEGGANSLHNSLSSELQGFYNVGTADDPSYFVVPWGENFWGLVYDKDMFEEKGLYSLDGYIGIDGEADTEDDFWGKDGIEGTIDDGLPATWEDLKLLMDYMVDQEIIPFIWSGSLVEYRTKFLNSIIANYEGIETYSTRYTLNGTFNGEPIDYTNGYKLTESEGIKAMLTVAKYIVSDSNYYHPDCNSSLNDQTKTQYTFMNSVRAINNTKPIGFMVEATWWEQEAKPSMATIVNDGGGEAYNYGNRHFGYMPFPCFIGSEETDGIKDQTNRKTVLTDSIGSSGSGIFINKNTKNLDLAKEFLRYFLSDEGRGIFTGTTGVLHPYRKDISTEQFSKLTTFAQDALTYFNSENSEIAGGRVYEGPFFEHNDFFYRNWQLRDLKDGNNSLSDPLKAFKLYPNMTVEDYLRVYKTEYYSKANWDKEFGL